MKRNKNAHRIVAMLLTVCMLIGILPISGLAEESVDSTEVLPNYLVDSFSDAQYVNGALYKWAASQSQSAERTVDAVAGSLHISNSHAQESDKNNAITYLTAADSTQDHAAAWTDYTVEAQLKFTGDKLTAQSKVGLVGRVQVTEGVITYYYAYIRNGNKNLFLAKGTIGADGVQTLTSITSKSLGTAVEAEKDYTLKLSFNGDVIKIYLDGEEQISATDPTYASGSVGIQFTRQGDAQVSYIKVIHNSDSTVFMDDFTDSRYLNGVTYQWSPDASDTWKVGDGVYEAVVKQLEPVAVTTKWNALDDLTNAAAGKPTSRSVADGCLLINNVGGNTDNNYANTYLSLMGAEEDYAANWTDYSVEVSVKLTDAPENTDKHKIAVLGRVTEQPDGSLTYYKLYCRQDNGYVYLRQCTLKDGTETEVNLGQYNIGVDVDADYVTLKMTFASGKVQAFVNGSSTACITADAVESHAAGSVGVQFKRKGTVSVDYIKVTDANGITLFNEEFTNTASLSGTAGYMLGSVYTEGDMPVKAEDITNVMSAWASKDKYATSKAPANGYLSITNESTSASDNNFSNTYLTLTDAAGNDYAAQWTDYSVEMKAKMSSLTTKTRLQVLGRVQVSDGAYTFYAAGLQYNTKTVYLQKWTIASDGTRTTKDLVSAAALSESFVAGQEHTLKMTFSGDQIQIFVDGTEKIKVNDNDAQTNGAALTAGSVGVQVVRNGTAVVDYIKVTDLNGCLLYAEEFTDENCLTGTEGYLLDGAFTAGEPVYAAAEPSVNLVTLQEGETNHATAWTDYGIEADISLENAASAAGLVARANGSNYYAFRVSADTAALYKVTSIGETLLVSTPAAVETGAWQFVKMDVSGSTIKCYLNGALMLSYDASQDTGAYTSGTVGLIAAGSVKFDNFAAYPMEAAEARRFVTYEFDVSNISGLDSNWNINAASWSVSEGKLTASGADNATLKNKTMMEDYYAETKGSAADGGRIGVIGRCSYDGSSYYLLTADVSTGVQLKKAVGGVTETLAAVSYNELYLQGVKLRPEADYTLRLQMYGDVIEGYIDGVRVIRYEDANALTIGVSGVQGTAGSAIEYLANGKVDAVVKLTVIDENGNAIATASNPWKVTLGKVPDIKLLKLKVEYYDGNSETIFLDTADVQAFVDGTELGSYQSKVEYCGGETVFHYAVVDRGGDIQQLEADLTAFDISNLTLDDETAVNALAARYNNLSYLEKKNISTANKEKVAAALEAIEFIKYPKLKGTDIVWKDEFDTVESEKHYISDVEVTARKYTGFWDVENGEMVCYDPDQVDYPSQYSCAASIEGYNWEIRSVTVDIQVLEENAWAGFYFCFRNNEFYKFVVTDKNDRIRLSKNNTLIENINSATVEDPLVFQVGQWYNIRVTMDEGGLIRCYVDDRLWIEYQDVPTVTDDEILTSGTVALSYAENYVKFDNLMVRGKVLEYTPDNEVTYNPNLEATEWADDFNDETAGKSPSHWIELNTEDNWLVEEDRTNLVYGNKDNTTGFSESWLHVFETDVDYTAKLRVTEKGYFPVVGLATRINTDESYIRGGYDFTLQKWFIKVRLGKDFEPVITYADTVDTNVDFTDWVTVRMLVEDKAIKLYVGDSNTPAVTADAGTKVMPGRVGLFAEQCNVQIDDVDLKLLSGQGRVNDGVLEQYTGSTGVTSLYHSILEMWDENGNQILLLYEDGNQSISTDGGQTFYPSTKYSAAGFRGNSSLELHDGSYLNIKKAGSGEREVFRSDDNGLSWPMVGVVGVDLSVNHAQPAEHINEYQMPDGTWRIFYCLARTATDLGRSSFGEVYYSDDRGATWTKSLTTPYDFSNLNHWSESYVVQIKKDVVDSRGVTLPAGALINYSSHQTSNSMRYSLSFDNGVTWEGDYAMPHLPGSCHSCCVKEDPYEPGTYYMAFTYNPSGMDEWGFPRYRISLMRSYDGYNWEYLCDVDRWGEVGDGNNGSQMQSINMYLCMTEDKVFVAFSRAEQFSNLTSHNLQYGRLYRFDKDKLEAYDPWPQEYIIPDKSITSIEVVSPKTTYTQGSDFSAEEGKVKVYYYDGTTGLFDLDETFITEPDLDTLGEAKVVVDFKHFRTIYKVNVVANTQSNDNTGDNTGDNIDSGNIGASTGGNASRGQTGRSDSGSADVPSQTDDSSQLSLALAAAVASAMALAVIALVGKRENA